VRGEGSKEKGIKKKTNIQTTTKKQRQRNKQG
jgi:hypothetical protein